VCGCRVLSGQCFHFLVTACEIGWFGFGLVCCAFGVFLWGVAEFLEFSAPCYVVGSVGASFLGI
jgi:hypothetical protein